MDLTNRSGVTPTNNRPIDANLYGNNVTNANMARNHSKKRGPSPGLSKWLTVIAGGIVALLLIALLLMIAFSGTKSQSQYVYSNKLQAVFLNSGQVYFGNIKSINSQYLVLDNIFYLQSNSNGSSSSSNSTNNVSLVKLGCELHAPYDQMVINMQQVTFWENLKSSGQVAKAVARYYQEYPNGQTCSNSTPSTSGVSSTPSTNSSPSSSTKKP
jgi:hypothetical protein